jgi:cysteine desulfurase
MTMKKPVYLDYHATTPVDDRVLQAMLPSLTTSFGNAASSTHAYGWDATAAVSVARESLLKSLKAPARASLIFTSGATESNNLAIAGLAFKKAATPLHFVTQATEHKSVLEPLAELQRIGHDVTVLPVDKDGLISADQLKAALKSNTCLVSIMWANNEIGVIQNVAELAEVTHAHSKALFHTDATQAAGKIGMDLSKTGIDLFSFSSHKIYGPKGSGALYINHPSPSDLLSPLFYGGGHEKGLRAGTLNVTGIVGLARAMEICAQEVESETVRIKKLKDVFWKILSNGISSVTLNGHPEKRLPHNLNFFIKGIPAASLMIQLPQLAFSSGSACTSGDTSGSHVIRALGRSDEEANGTLRFSFGRFTTEQEATDAAHALVAAVKALKDLGVSR